MENILEQYAQVIIEHAGPLLATVPQEQRDLCIEGSLTGYVRLGLMHWPPAKMAAKLRELSDAIEHG